MKWWEWYPDLDWLSEKYGIRRAGRPPPQAKWRGQSGDAKVIADFAAGVMDRLRDHILKNFPRDK